MITRLVAFLCILSSHVTVGYLKCNGGFDIFFLFDRSASVEDNYEKYMIPFVKNLAQNFVSPHVQYSLIKFGTAGHLVQGLTKDVSLIQRQLDQMARTPPPEVTQGTNIGGGLQHVDTSHSSSNKLVFIISDGCDNEPFQADTAARVTALRAQGVEIFIVYIPSGGEQCPAYLKQIASKPVESHYFPILTAPYYDQLNRPDFIDSLLVNSCLEVTHVSPSRVCNRNRRTVEVLGKGFTLGQDLSSFICRFQPTSGPQSCADTSTYAPQCPTWAQAGECESSPDFMRSNCGFSCGSCGVVPAYVANDGLLWCQTPELSAVGEFSFEISRNGMTWTQDEIRISSYDQCNDADDPPLSEKRASLSVEAVSTSRESLQFQPTDASVRVSLLVQNDGVLALDGPVGVYSQGFDEPVVCTHTGILSAGQSTMCTGVRALSAEDLRLGRVVITVFAEAEHPVLGTKIRSPELRTEITAYQTPTVQRTAFPTRQPTPAPTTQQPTPQPSFFPTRFITRRPTPYPTKFPTPFPTVRPTESPTPAPSTPDPTQSPTPPPTPVPTTPMPTDSPTTAQPTARPTAEPTSFPTLQPTPVPTPDINVTTLGVPNALPPMALCTDWVECLACVPVWVWVVAVASILLLCCLWGLFCAHYYRQNPTKGHTEVAQQDPDGDSDRASTAGIQIDGIAAAGGQDGRKTSEDRVGHMTFGDDAARGAENSAADSEAEEQKHNGADTGNYSHYTYPTESARR